MTQTYNRLVCWNLYRIIHAMANAMVITSTFTYTACEFPTSVAKIFSITRCFFMYVLSYAVEIC